MREFLQGTGCFRKFSFTLQNWRRSRVPLLNPVPEHPLTNRPPESRLATPSQVGELSPKRVQNTYQCKVSFTSAGPALLEGSWLDGRTAHVALILGWGRWRLVCSGIETAFAQYHNLISFLRDLFI